MKMDVKDDNGASVVSAVDAPIYWWEIFFFGVLGVMGGVLGGVGVIILNKLEYLRPKRALFQVNPQPSTLKPQPSTLKPQTSNLKPQT